MMNNGKEENIHIEIIYKPKENEKDIIRIFGKKFVKKNKDKCKIIYKGKEYELKEYFEDIDNNYNHNKNIILKIRINNIITDASFMFSQCHNLISFLDLPQLNNSALTDISDESKAFDSLSLSNETKNSISEGSNLKNIYDYSFKKSLSLSSINKNDISSETNITDIFSTRNSLSYLINSNATNLRNMFYECKSLISLPDISKWNTENVIDMVNMFYECNSLISLPDISKWNTDNVTDMNGMFYGCKSLITLPDISYWKINKVIDISNMFYGCNKLISLPDISKWNTSNISNMSGYFIFVIH